MTWTNLTHSEDLEVFAEIGEEHLLLPEKMGPLTATFRHTYLNSTNHLGEITIFGLIFSHGLLLVITKMNVHSIHLITQPSLLFYRRANITGFPYNPKDKSLRAQVTSFKADNFNLTYYLFLLEKPHKIFSKELSTLPDCIRTPELCKKVIEGIDKRWNVSFENILQKINLTYLAMGLLVAIIVLSSIVGLFIYILAKRNRKALSHEIENELTNEVLLY